MSEPDMHEAIVIGAGQAGLSASFHLQRLGVEHVVLDANVRPGGAWQHRWDALTMADVHGVADLPESRRSPAASRARANEAVPAYFSAYERDLGLPVVRPVQVRSVARDGAGFLLEAVGDDGPASWRSRTIVNATGTWTRPFVPHYPGQETFAGRQLHTVDFPGPDWFAGHRTIVVGAGASAVQFLGMLAPVVGADALVWATRHAPDWRHETFTPELGRAAVALVEERVQAGLAPLPVVAVTGLHLREQEREAERLGVYAARRQIFDRIEPLGVRWDVPVDGGSAFEPADVILWATGFRYAVGHLAPLGLKSPAGGIRLLRDGTTAAADPRVQLVGYGPSASTIGASRAGRSAARGVARALRETTGG